MIQCVSFIAVPAVAGVPAVEGFLCDKMTVFSVTVKETLCINVSTERIV